MKTETSLDEYQACKRSVAGRLSRLRETYAGYRRGRKQTPIQQIGVFEEDIQSMEQTLLNMQSRLDNATITIEI